LYGEDRARHGGQPRLDIDEHVLPIAKVPASGRYDLKRRLVCAQDLDNGFGGWGGTCRISDPGAPFRVEFSSADVAFFQLYSPRAGGCSSPSR
jgi:aldose 1-epimerase